VPRGRLAWEGGTSTIGAIADGSDLTTRAVVVSCCAAIWTSSTGSRDGARSRRCPSGRTRDTGHAAARPRWHYDDARSAAASPRRTTAATGMQHRAAQAADRPWWRIRTPRPGSQTKRSSGSCTWSGHSSALHAADNGDRGGNRCRWRSRCPHARPARTAPRLGHDLVRLGCTPLTTSGRLPISTHWRSGEEPGRGGPPGVARQLGA